MRRPETTFVYIGLFRVCCIVLLKSVLSHVIVLYHGLINLDRPRRKFNKKQTPKFVSGGLGDRHTDVP
jgi:hypothetical protein